MRCALSCGVLVRRTLRTSGDFGRLMMEMHLIDRVRDGKLPPRH